MKPYIFFFIASCLSTSYAMAQPIESNLPPRVRPIRANTAPASLVTVTFTTDDTCNLKIDNTDYRDFTGNKPVKLPLGNHKLLFESLETGKIIRDRSFRLTKERATGGKYTYTVTFKQ